MMAAAKIWLYRAILGGIMGIRAAFLAVLIAAVCMAVYTVMGSMTPGGNNIERSYHNNVAVSVDGCNGGHWQLKVYSHGNKGLKVTVAAGQREESFRFASDTDEHRVTVEGPSNVVIKAGFQTKFNQLLGARC
jgi:hypothetical protein